MVNGGKTLLAALAVVLAFPFGPASAQKTGNVGIKALVQQHFDSISSDVDLKKLTVEKVTVSDKGRRLDVSLSQTFSYQRFRRELVDSIKAGLLRDLPEKYAGYSVGISSNGYPIEEMIPEWTLQKAPAGAGIAARPWKRDASRPLQPSQGLQGVTLAVTPSHGLYYDRGDTAWRYQRPALYCSREDLLTQSIAYPYLIPMLENAGAVVFCERERDWQENAVVTGPDYGGEYRETGTWSSVKTGGYNKDSLRIVPDSIPVVTRIANAGPGVSGATAMWVPDIPESGSYAVYVTYSSDSTRIDDARYIVYHTGGSTVFHVNQRMGGGTWLYLGSFQFEKGQGPAGMVSLDNSSAVNGTVSADAVRFGGGTATETREGLSVTAPRYLFGTRYYGSFAGAPDSVTFKYSGADDYREDIWARPYMANWAAGASDYNMKSPGLGVPVCTYFALHTDAGYNRGDTLYGSLGICTTNFNKGVLATGQSRLVSRGLADMAVSELLRDFKAATGRDWAWRGIWDKNYCESRETQMKSVLVELLSHQNFWDMKLALDPNFQFMAARSLYKAILKENRLMEGRDYVVQPLPVSSFRIDSNGDRLELRWQETPDSLEPTARADGYIVYCSVDGKGFDNGTAVKGNSYVMTPEKGRIYRFKVTASNSGGESMDSEILAACLVKGAKRTALIVNGFDRLGPPAVIENDSLLGFDIEADAGVQYRRSPILCGRQTVFDRSLMDLDEKLQTGASDSSLEGQLLAGNSFDYPYIHGQAFVNDGWSFVSCSRGAFADGKTPANRYAVVDLVLGFQKHSDTDATFNHDYSCFPGPMRQALDSYLGSGGSLLVSGSHVASDLSDPAQVEFARNRLHYSFASDLKDMETCTVDGRRIARFDIFREWNSERMGVRHPDVLKPESRAERMLTYGNSKNAAAVSFKNATYRSVVLGFPFECITSGRERDHVMKYILNYLIDK